jgi:hypothetical protein
MLPERAPALRRRFAGCLLSELIDQRLQDTVIELDFQCRHEQQIERRGKEDSEQETFEP